MAPFKDGWKIGLRLTVSHTILRTECQAYEESGAHCSIYAQRSMRVRCAWLWLTNTWLAYDVDARALSERRNAG